MTKRVLVIGLAALVILIGCVVIWRQFYAGSVSLDGITKRDRALRLFLATDQAPPTNKWFSSLAFKSPSEPVFAYPLAFKTTEQGVAMSYPVVRANKDVVMASFQPDITLDFGKPVTAYITRYDDLSVELELKSDTDRLATARITQGSPYLFMELEPHVTVTASQPMISQGDQNFTIAAPERKYGVYAGGDLQINAAKVSNGAGKSPLALFAIPESADMNTMKSAARHPITRTEVQYKTTATTVETTFLYETKDNVPTPVALLPDQQPKGSEGSYATLLGKQSIELTNQHAFTTPLGSIPNELPLEKLSETQRQTLKDTLKSEAKSVMFTKNDSYFSGKEFYKVANLLQLAQQLGLAEEASELRAGLRTGLEKWLEAGASGETDGTYFYYDKTAKGIVGVPSAFGSEDFNDHHFHYGYFLYASAILAQYDQSFLGKNQPVLSAIAADIASTKRNDTNFPYLRVFDQYAGHSWASGFVPFADGNNQESSSEAVNAWYGLAKWADVTKDDDLKQAASWLYAREVQAAKSYYLNFDRSRPELSGYSHSIVSILWGGKFDYATFFDASPEAKLAIQLLPLNPGATYLTDDVARARQNYEAMVNEGGGSPVMFRDYLAMYQAAFDRQAALRTAESLADTDIDGANSRSYMLAWIYSR
jgi:endo-1,3(4)-beta-glucanase